MCKISFISSVKTCLIKKELAFVDEGVCMLFLLGGKIFVVSMSMMPRSPDKMGAWKRVVLLDILIKNMFDTALPRILGDFVDVRVYIVEIKWRVHIVKPRVGCFGPMRFIIVIDGGASRF